jgi:alpha-1,2-mannosyltransferase
MMTVLAVLAACLSLALWMVWVYRHQHELWTMMDLHVLDWGGQMARYNPSALYKGQLNGLPFLYPPFSALIYAGLNHLPFDLLKVLEVGAVIASVFAVVWLALKMVARHQPDPMPRQTRLAATLFLGAGALWLEPVQQTLFFGQVSSVLMLMVVADLALDDERRFKGALIGLATGFKLTPGLFIIYLLLTRRFRAAALASASFLATAVAGFTFLPDQAREFWSPSGLMSLSARVDVWYARNQSMYGYLVRAFSAPDAARNLWLIAALLVAVAGLGMAAVLFRRCGEPSGMLTTALVTLLVSPISWTHYWVWVIPSLVWGAHEAWTRRRSCSAIPLAATAALFFAYPLRIDPSTGLWDEHRELLPGGVVSMVPQLARRELDWVPWQQVLGNLYLIVGLAALVVVMDRLVISNQRSVSSPALARLARRS